MALKLSDCPPHLYNAIMAQLAKEGREFPQEPIPKYAVANLIGDHWVVGPPTENLKLLRRIVSKQQLRSPRAAYMAAIGKPLSVVINFKQEK